MPRSSVLDLQSQGQVVPRRGIIRLEAQGFLKLGISIGHRLSAHLHQPDCLHQRSAKSQPPCQQIWMPPPLEKSER